MLDADVRRDRAQPLGPRRPVPVALEAATDGVPTGLRGRVCAAHDDPRKTGVRIDRTLSRRTAGRSTIANTCPNGHSSGAQSPRGAACTDGPTGRRFLPLVNGCGTVLTRDAARRDRVPGADHPRPAPERRDADRSDVERPVRPRRRRDRGPTVRGHAPPRRRGDGGEQTDQHPRPREGHDVLPRRRPRVLHRPTAARAGDAGRDPQRCARVDPQLLGRHRPARPRVDRAGRRGLAPGVVPLRPGQLDRGRGTHRDRPLRLPRRPGLAPCASRSCR